MTRALRVHLGLGANLGDPAHQIGEALRLIDGLPGVAVVAVSSLYETEPVGPPQPRYRNAAAELRVAVPLRALLDALQGIEVRLGRIRTDEARWGPRRIDLDLLLAEECVVAEPGLAVPHPRLAERPFVLVPLAEIAPEARHPILGRTVRELLATCPAADPPPRIVGAASFRPAPATFSGDFT
jgi:2-amino-4-hydroxy-6-hydroxymethyldihydropteridine diphosphokinase